MYNQIKVEFQRFVKGNSVMQNVELPPPPPRRREKTVDELKSTLIAKLLAEGSADDMDMIHVLRRQADHQAAALAQS